MSCEYPSRRMYPGVRSSPTVSAPVQQVCEGVRRCCMCFILLRARLPLHTRARLSSSMTSQMAAGIIPGEEADGPGPAPGPGGEGPPKKPLRRLSPRAYAGATFALPLTVLCFFCAGVLGTFLQTDLGATSWLAYTWMGRTYLRAVTAAPLLNTLFFNGSALGTVLLLGRLGEHKRAPPPPPPQPRSRQERRRWEADARKAGKDRRQHLQALEERVRAVGGRILKVRE